MVCRPVAPCRPCCQRGEKSVDPSSTPIPVDAEFEYGAPDEPNKTGTVSLEARSKRGIGRVDIKFDTAGPPRYVSLVRWGTP